MGLIVSALVVLRGCSACRRQGPPAWEFDSQASGALREVVPAGQASTCLGRLRHCCAQCRNGRRGVRAWPGVPVARAGLSDAACATVSPGLHRLRAPCQRPGGLPAGTQVLAQLEGEIGGLVALLDQCLRTLHFLSTKCRHSPQQYRHTKEAEVCGSEFSHVCLLTELDYRDET